MPTSVTATNGDVFHLWQLPDLSVPAPNESFGVSKLRNDLGDGYRSQRLVGADTGIRKFKLKLPTLAGRDVLPNTVQDIHGALVSREQYIWNLYEEWCVNGTPFAYTSRRDGFVYLVEFEDERLEYDGMKVKIYQTGLNLTEVRLPGVTIFDTTKLVNTYNVTTYIDGGGFVYTVNNFWELEQGGGAWDGAIDVVSSGGILIPTAQNGHDILRLNGTTDLLQTDTNLQTDPVFDLFLAIKMREATFSNAAGIFTDDSTVSYLKGKSGTTRFDDAGVILSGAEYRKNGVLYAVDNMQAPMNEWGIIHLRHTGSGFTNGSGVWRIGKNQNTAGTFANLDIGHIIVATERLPMNLCRQIVRYMAVRWNVE